MRSVPRILQSWADGWRVISKAAVFYVFMRVFLFPVQYLYQQIVENPGHLILNVSIGLIYLVFPIPFLALLASRGTGIFTDSTTPEEIRKDNQIAARNLSIRGLLHAGFWVGFLFLAAVALAVISRLR